MEAYHAARRKTLPSVVPAIRELFRTGSRRRKSIRGHHKKAMEIARYVLPVATFGVPLYSVRQHAPALRPLCDQFARLRNKGSCPSDGGRTSKWTRDTAVSSKTLELGGTARRRLLRRRSTTLPRRRAKVHPRIDSRMKHPVLDPADWSARRRRPGRCRSGSHRTTRECPIPKRSDALDPRAPRAGRIAH